VDNSVAIVAVLLIAAIALFIGVMLGGAGHGWVAPFFYSLGLLVAYPVALVRMRNAARTPRVDIAMLGVGAGASLLLLLDIRALESDYFWRIVDFDMGLPLVFAWLCLWFGWQILVLANAIRAHFRPVP